MDTRQKLIDQIKNCSPQARNRLQKAYKNWCIKPYIHEI